MHIDTIRQAIVNAAAKREFIFDETANSMKVWSHPSKRAQDLVVQVNYNDESVTILSPKEKTMHHTWEELNTVDKVEMTARLAALIVKTFNKKFDPNTVIDIRT